MIEGMFMKHKIKVKVPVEKRGFLGIKKTVVETCIIEVDGKTYKKLKKECRMKVWEFPFLMGWVVFPFLRLSQ